MNKNSLLNRLRRKLKYLKDKSWSNLKFIFNPYCKKSFSQCGEDLIVKHIFDSLNILYPTYIDIGAHHPYKFNNTALFYLLGSKGVNIEPDPILFSEFPTSRPNDINLNIGIASQEDNLDFFIMSSRTLNTFSKEKAEDYQTNHNVPISEIKSIPVHPISKIIKQYGNKTFWDFMSIDVEGFELDILESLDWNGQTPKVICCETLTFSADGIGEKEQNLIDFLKCQGYEIYADTKINTIFVKQNLWK